MYMHMRRSLNDYGRYIGVCVCVLVGVYVVGVCANQNKCFLYM